MVNRLSYARGIEEWIGTLMIVDRAPKAP